MSGLQGKDLEAIALLRAVADKQDVEGKEEIELPAREVLGDLLLEMRRPADALAEYENSMKKWIQTASMACIAQGEHPGCSKSVKRSAVITVNS